MTVAIPRTVLHGVDESGLSTARPANPNMGSRFYDEDTQTLSIYDTTLGKWINFGPSAGPVSATSIATVGNGTLTAAALASRLIIRTGPTAAFSDATDTAANIIAAMATPVVGQSFMVEIANETNFVETITAGMGVTLAGQTVLQPNSVGRFLVKYTGAGAVSMSGIGFYVIPPAGSGSDPASQQTQFGGSAGGSLLGSFGAGGNLYRNAGNPIAGNTADTNDDILGGIQLPAGAFDVAGRALSILAIGITGANTNNKRFKVFVNPTMTGQTVNADGSISGGHVTAGTPVCDSGAWVNGTTPNNASGWQAQVELQKYGAAGSNTQIAAGQAILGALHGGQQAPQALTLPENAVINIVVTGSSYTTGAANDVKLNLLQAQAMD